MKISIITAAYNSGTTIGDTLQSVAEQQGVEIEHIIVDGGSKDATVSIVQSFPHVSQFISEPDQGIYDAMNKGIRMATGNIVGILNADDFFPSTTTLRAVLDCFDASTDAIFGDIAFVRPNALDKVVRYYSAKGWTPAKFRWGFMPPHPSFYLRREHYLNHGLYQIDYQIASDYELLIRMLHKHKLRFKYLPVRIVTMRTGGVSTKNWNSNYILNKEIVRGCGENGIYTNMLFLCFKYFRKAFELVRT